MSFMKRPRNIRSNYNISVFLFTVWFCGLLEIYRSTLVGPYLLAFIGVNFGVLLLLGPV